ncbi:MAG: pre-peptidase C-terminal domain-containing protein [Myxococcales bacterium]|nr:pre-peptidase C-terminal domain-containing protein [Myxococcales bacterium]
MMSKKALMATAVLVVGCYNGMDGSDYEEQRQAEAEEIVENLALAGFPRDEIGVLEDGTVYVGSDAIVTLEASREMIGIDGSGFRQYRTTNTVDTSTVGTICIDPTAELSSNALMVQALDLAITHYNEQGLQFTMARDGAGCNAATADAVITGNLDNSSGGVSGFPSGGLPYFEFYVGQNLASNYGVAVAAHVIQHELGHCIGFRHTDYYDRSISCGGGPTNEGDGGVGAIHIPGTPTDAVMNGSVMNSCYNGSSNGTWTASDIVALDCMYDTGSCAPEPPPSYDTSLASLSNLSGARRSQTIYGPYDATGYDALRVQMSGGSGDADLYVRFGAQPTKSTYDCRPYVSGNEEACEFNPSQDGQYWVMVYGYSAYSGLSLDVDAAGAGGPPPPPAEVCDNGVDDDGDGNADCADSDCAGDPACAGGGNCGNGVCDDGESCDGRNGTDSCPADCDGVTGGKPSNRWCEVGAGCEGPACP